MYWIFLILFIITVLIPDIIRGNVFFLSQTRAEEATIFLMGVITFVVFTKREQLISFQKKEKEEDQKKIDQAIKDLLESYSYIGEVNRKMDILMNIALGLADRSVLSKAKEEEVYQSIISAANFLMKADASSLRFVDLESGKTEKELNAQEKRTPIKNSDLAGMKKDVAVEKKKDCLIVSSAQKINNIKSYLLICGYDREAESNPKNLEMLKVFASQALFLHSYARGETKIGHN
jgi:hypothetical protein